MKTYIQLICMALIVVINYSCEKKIPVIEHSISGVLYLDHTLQPAANYEVRLQYNSQAYSLRDTKILDECTTDENGNFYLKYVKIAGAGELEIENNGGTALLTEIPVNEDINFSFPIKPFTNLDVNFNYNRPLEFNDTVFIDFSHVLNPSSIPGLVYIDFLNKYYLMLNSIYQPITVNTVSRNVNSYKELNNTLSSDYCGKGVIGFGLENLIKNDSTIRALRGYTENLEDSTFRYYCHNPTVIDPYNRKLLININLPD